MFPFTKPDLFELELSLPPCQMEDLLEQLWVILGHEEAVQSKQREQNQKPGDLNLSPYCAASKLYYPRIQDSLQQASVSYGQQAQWTQGF